MNISLTMVLRLYKDHNWFITSDVTNCSIIKPNQTLGVPIGSKIELKLYNILTEPNT